MASSSQPRSSSSSSTSTPTLSSRQFGVDEEMPPIIVADSPVGFESKGNDEDLKHHDERENDIQSNITLPENHQQLGQILIQEEEQKMVDLQVDVEVEGNNKLLEFHDDDEHHIYEDVSQMESPPEIHHQPGQKVVHEQDQKMRDLVGHFLQSPQGQNLIRNAVSTANNPIVSSFAPSSIATKTRASNAYDFETEEYLADDFPITSTKTTRPIASARYSNASILSLPNVLSKHLRKVELDADKKFPQDSYSILALNGPKGKSWPLQKRLFFLFGLIPFIFQLGLLGLLIASVIDIRRGTVGVDNDNPDSASGFYSKFIAANAKNIVRVTQFVSLAVFAVFPSSSLGDVAKALQYFPRFPEAGVPTKVAQLTCILRLIQGIMAIVVVFLLVITADNVVEIILNFTAVNFVSDLDDKAFELAKSGIFGPKLRDETLRIGGTDLPASMYTPVKHRWYGMTMAGTAATLFTLLIIVAVAQERKDVWTTKTLRLQFAEDTSLSAYSGCFEMNDNVFYQRRTYNSLDQSALNTSIGYCIDDYQWIFFQGSAETIDPCKAGNLEIARSSKTDTFDISTSFGGAWVSPTNEQLDLYFFQGDDELYCDLSLGDGVCDDSFNIAEYQYDRGDCCGSTCVGSDCGRGDLSPFGNSNISGSTGFQNCKDPEMFPITIHLNDIKSSRSPEFARFNCKWDIELGINDWTAVQPVNPYFALECNNKYMLNLYIDESMVNKPELVMIPDGAKCTLEIQNTTDQEDLSTDQPIWFINYTISHGNHTTSSGEENDIENERVDIMTQHSREVKNVYFQRIPECYFKDLNPRVDDSSILYSRIDWQAVDIDKDDAQCGERYALFALFLYMKGKDIPMNKPDQCTWPSVICTKGQVTGVDLSYKSLEGPIPNELELLASLEELKMRNNEITSIPSVIGTITNLKLLDFTDNQIASIPKEIGTTKNLVELHLNENQIISIPSEMTMLANLTELNMDNNLISSIPSTIGSMESLAVLGLDHNLITSIPSEIGTLVNMTKLGLENNKITVIPSEIGMLSKMTTLNFENNQVTSIPSEIGMLTDMELLFLATNRISTIPSEIGMITNHLIRLFLGGNEIVSIPSEIGMMKNLIRLNLENNLITSIPTTIGEMERLEKLYLFDNRMESVPSEIGMMRSLRSLFLQDNLLKSIPTEIWQMANLYRIDLSGNQINLIPSQIGMMEKLSELIVGNNQITSIPSEIVMMKNLTEISLDNNNIKSIPPDIIGNLKNVTILNLDGNKINSIPSEVGMMESLQKLSLNKNKIKAIPSAIFMMANMTVLELAKNKFKRIPSKIGMMVNLTRLQFENNEITSIPSEIGMLRNLTRLDLDGNKIEAIPNEMGMMIKLNRLNLYDNLITSIPSEIGSLTNLLSFICYDNDINSIPSEIGMMTKLLRVHLYDNQIKLIPSEMGMMENLVELYLGNNQIELIPTEILMMKNLTDFDLNNNRITSIPSEIGLMTNVRELNLNGNLVTSLPSEIWMMTNLTTLNLGNNQITSIPSEIGMMKNLEKLFLNDNQLTSIPSEIGMMANLSELNLWNNQITSIPSEIGMMKNLERLHLDDNEITAIPSEIGMMGNLKLFDLCGNNITSIPDEIDYLNPTVLDLLFSCDSLFLDDDTNFL